MRAVAQVLDVIGRVIARYLERPVQGYEPFTPSDPSALRQSLKPGDVLLVEGNSHISRVIKYLTQSTWSHAALRHLLVLILRAVGTAVYGEARRPASTLQGRRVPD